MNQLKLAKMLLTEMITTFPTNEGFALAVNQFLSEPDEVCEWKSEGELSFPDNSCAENSGVFVSARLSTFKYCPVCGRKIKHEKGKENKG